MVDIKKLKILHLLSQRPDSTGSGIYVQAMIRKQALMVMTIIWLLVFVRIVLLTLTALSRTIPYS